MNIGLLNLEPKYKNLALEKLRIYHQSTGDYVENYFALNKYDKVYVSSIFTFTVTASAIPEFPDVATGVGVVFICVLVWWLMKRQRR